VIDHPAFTVEPWSLRETELRTEVLAQTESVFALSNGHIGVRANLDEGEPHGLPGSYLNSVYELRPLPYAEAGFGYPESGQTVINVTNGKLIRLLVDDEPFDIRYGDLEAHERLLDFRAGTLHRTVHWTSPAGRTVVVRSTRLVSFTHRSLLAVAYEVEAVDAPMRLVVQSELVTNEQLPSQEADPRVAAALDAPLVSVEHLAAGSLVSLVHSTRRSGLLVSTSMDHVVQAADDCDVDVTSESSADFGRVTVTARLRPGQRLRLVKFVCYGWSSQRSVPSLRDQVRAGLVDAVRTGWDGLVAGQRAFLDEFWAGADVEVDGDPELQQAVRFALFHVLQAGARAERRPIAAKGLTGPGYDGHSFWDTETFVLPVLTYTHPRAARDALHWRHSTLPIARLRAALLDLAGAAFPWRTINGEECSGYWPAGTAAFHVSADVADAVVRYHDATGDDAFVAETGLETLVETARLWRSLGHHDPLGRFRIDGVTGPDEYSAIADNNVYTNLMAARNMTAAADLATRFPDTARALGVDAEETAAWRDAAQKVVLPYDQALGVHCQSEGFTGHQVWDFARTLPEQYPLLLHFPYFDLYRKQVVKQADLVLAMHLRGDAFTAEQKAANFDYYERLTVRDSSLSACTQAVVAAEVGHLDLAYAYTVEAASMDLEDLEHNTRDGLHMASLAGAWIALVAGFGGMRDHGGGLSFAPRLPDGLSRLAFTVLYRGGRLRVETASGAATYGWTGSDQPLALYHHGQPVVLQPGTSQQLPVPRVVPRREPSQPVGRAPVRRRETSRPAPAGHGGGHGGATPGP
jgi:alpha,alpha-trehalose phosphorylase